MRPHYGAGEESQEEGAVEAKCYELTASDPIPHPTAMLEGEGVEGLGEKVT